MAHKPQAGDRVVCPLSRTKRSYPPVSVYDGIAPDGKTTVKRGILDSHHHGWGAPECAYTGLPVPLENQ